MHTMDLVKTSDRNRQLERARRTAEDKTNDSYEKLDAMARTGLVLLRLCGGLL